MYYYKKWKRKGQYVVIDKHDWLAGCWIMPAKYPTIKGQSVHRTYAPGHGPVVRHLCCNNRCINPLHMLRGSQLENVNDEFFKNRICRGNIGGVLSDYWYYRLWFKGNVMNMLMENNREDKGHVEAVDSAHKLMMVLEHDKYITVMEDKYGKEKTVL